MDLNTYNLLNFCFVLYVEHFTTRKTGFDHKEIY